MKDETKEISCIDMKYIIDVLYAELAVPDFHTMVQTLKNGILLMDGKKVVLYVSRCCTMLLALNISLIVIQLGILLSDLTLD